MLKNIRHITLLFVILIGVISNFFASDVVHDTSKISFKKSVVEIESIKASVGLISKQVWRTNVNYLTKVARYTDSKLGLIGRGGVVNFVNDIFANDPTLRDKLLDLLKNNEPNNFDACCALLGRLYPSQADGVADLLNVPLYNLFKAKPEHVDVFISYTKSNKYGDILNIFADDAVMLRNFEDLADATHGAALRAAMVQNPGLVRAWGAISIDEIHRVDPNNLIKVENYANDFGKSFDDIRDEFVNVPVSQRSAWIDYLEFRTKPSGSVNKAGNQSSKYGTYTDNPSVPARYSSDNRFTNLASDPAVGNLTPKTRQEAMAGLEAENQGFISSPIARDPSGAVEFFDGSGSPWDVKGPRSGFSTNGTNYFNVNQAGGSIKSELAKSSVPNSITGIPEPRKVILDCTYMTPSDFSDLRTWLTSELSASDLNRIIEVNSNLFGN